jgi:hypothetical protein
VEWFGLAIRGHVTIDQPGDYQFFLASDDGSRLFIDDQLVIDNDGEHSVEEKSGKMYLTSGVHEIRVDYFQGSRNRLALTLQWQAPDASAQSYIPLARLQSGSSMVTMP